MRLRYERSLTCSEVCTQFSVEELRNPFETNSRVAEYILLQISTIIQTQTLINSFIEFYYVYIFEF